MRVLRDPGLAAATRWLFGPLARGRIDIERADDLIKRYAGCLPAGTYPPGDLDRLRDEWRQ